ncbi:MAG: hypothetical protein AAGI88_25420 [Pseudomonadota bacterium]
MSILCGMPNSTSLLFVLAMSLLRSGELLACTCGEPIDPDLFVDRAKSIIIATPNRVEVIDKSGVGTDAIIASVILLDVLKGPSPDVLPNLTTEVSDSNYVSSCHRSIAIGRAYVLFLEEVNEPSVHFGACMPHELFEVLRVAQERSCAERSEPDRCSHTLLKMLRQADVANEKYPALTTWR